MKCLASTSPTIYRERMRTAVHPQQEGVQIAQEILRDLRPHVQGVYMMPAFGRFDLVADVLDILQERQDPAAA